MQQAYSYGPNITVQPPGHPPQAHSCPGSSKHHHAVAAPQPDMQPWTDVGVPPGIPHGQYPQHIEGYYHQYGTSEYAYPAQVDISQADPPGIAGGWFDFSNACYLKGFALGAVATLLLTNATVQKTLVRGLVKVWSIVQGGVEEVKETFQDVKAEMSLDKQ